MRTSDGSAPHISASPPATPASMRSVRDRYSPSTKSAASGWVEGQARGVALDVELDDRVRGAGPCPGVTITGQAALLEVGGERELLFDLEAQRGVRRHTQLQRSRVGRDR